MRPDPAPTTIYAAPTWFYAVVGLSVLLALTRYGRDFLIPLTVAFLLFLLITGLINRLKRIPIGSRPMPGWLAHLLSLVLVLGGFVAGLSILSTQISAIVAMAPRYEARVETIVSGVASFLGDEVTAKVQSALAEINLAGWASSALGSAGATLSTVLLVLLYLIFLVAEQRSFRRKLPRLCSSEAEAKRMALVLNSVSVSMQRYVFITTFVSGLTGLLTYAILSVVGVDFAATLSLLAFFFNFIPTIGSIIGVVLPAVVTMVQFDAPTPFLIVVLGCGVMQVVVGNVVQPTLAGKSLNLSAFIIILALTFWGAIWGLAGALLSVPLAIMMMIVCAHVPALKPIAVLMSRDGQLPDGAED
jgi:Predicted permease